MATAAVTEPRVVFITPTDEAHRASIEPGPVKIWPGVKATKKGTLIVPENAEPVVRRFLNERGMHYVVEHQGPPTVFDPLCAGCTDPQPILGSCHAHGPTWTFDRIVEKLSGEIMSWVPEYLTAYQRHGLEWVCNRVGSIVVWPTGAGKTLLTILGAFASDGPLLFITKASARRAVYGRQIQQYTKIKPRILYGLTPEKLSRDERAYIVGWETLSAWRDELCRLRPAAVVYDEIHMAKQFKRRTREPQPDGTYRYESRKNMSESAEAIGRVSERRIGATATPIPNRRIDLWGQLSIVEPFGHGTYAQWGFRYCGGRKGTWGGLEFKKETNTQDLQMRLDTVLHRVTYAEAHRELPPKRRTTLYVGADDQDRPAAFRRELKKAQSNKRKLVETQLMEAASRKRTFVSELVIEALKSDQKVTVFTGRRKDSEKLHAKLLKALDKAGLKDTPSWHGHGGFTVTERETMVDEYMALIEGPALFVGTGDAFGESIEMNRTDVVVFAMLPYTPRQIIQWEGRFMRKGQDRPVIYYYVIAEGTRDEAVADILIDKFPDVEKIVGDQQVSGIVTSLEGLDDEDAVMDSLIATLEEGF